MKSEQTENNQAPSDHVPVDHFDQKAVTVNICANRADTDLYVNSPLSRHRTRDWTEQHRHHTVKGGFAAAWDFVVNMGYRPSAGVDLCRDENGAMTYAVIDFAATGSTHHPMPLKDFVAALNLLTDDPEWVAERIADDPRALPHC